jgi:hypothetical protein
VDYHVLTGTPDGNRFRFAFHVPVPGTGTNRAGIQWRTALIDSGLGGSTVLPDGDGTGGTISAAEKAEVEAGSVYELIRQIDTNPGETATQFRDRVDSLFPGIVSQTQAHLQNALSYFGFTRDVP